MSQLTRQNHFYEHLTTEQLIVNQSIQHGNQKTNDMISDTIITEHDSGILFKVKQNAIRIQLPVRPRAGCTVRIRNDIANATFLLLFGKEDTFLGGGIQETAEGTHLRCVKGQIGDEIVLVGDGVDGYIISSIVGFSWIPLVM